MIHYLLDTNVISEMTRPEPDTRVTRWLSQLSFVTLPAIGIYEIAFGIQRLSEGKKREALADWLTQLLNPASAVLPFDRDAALTCAVLNWEARRRGQTVELRDLFILAIAKSQNLGIATRNVSHFRGFDVPVYDPFEDMHFL